MVISKELAQNGKIIDLNSTCGALLGYEKYELVNRPASTVFPTEMEQQSMFLDPEIKAHRFFLLQKNECLV